MNADEHRLTEEAMNALAYELQRTGVDVQQQEPIKVYYQCSPVSPKPAFVRIRSGFQISSHGAVVCKRMFVAW